VDADNILRSAVSTCCAAGRLLGQHSVAALVMPLTAVSHQMTAGPEDRNGRGARGARGAAGRAAGAASQAPAAAAGAAGPPGEAGRQGGPGVQPKSKSELGIGVIYSHAAAAAGAAGPPGEAGCQGGPRSSVCAWELPGRRHAATQLSQQAVAAGGLSERMATQNSCKMREHAASEQSRIEPFRLRPCAQWMQPELQVMARPHVMSSSVGLWH
jgi:hypothetical protein